MICKNINLAELKSDSELVRICTQIVMTYSGAHNVSPYKWSHNTGNIR